MEGREKSKDVKHVLCNGISLFSYAGSPSKVCQPLDCIIICRVKSDTLPSNFVRGQ